MSEEEKYIKKRNKLIVIFMLLLVVFIGLICYIFIYVKQHPKKEYTDPETIVIKEMITEDTNFTAPSYTELTESNDFVINNNEEQINLFVENNTVKYTKNDAIETVILDLNGNDINGQVKYIYQKNEDSFILMNNGLIYKLLDNTMTENNTIKLGQILNSKSIKNIITFEEDTTTTYAITEDNQIIDVVTGNPYDGVIMELECSGGILYIYSDYSVGYDRNTHFVDAENNTIKYNVVFESKLYDELGQIYELDFTNKTLKTSKLDKMATLSYYLDNGMYVINTETTTGKYEYRSSYYYSK